MWSRDGAPCWGEQGTVSAGRGCKKDSPGSAGSANQLLERCDFSSPASFIQLTGGKITWLGLWIDVFISLRVAPRILQDLYCLVFVGVVKKDTKKKARRAYFLLGDFFIIIIKTFFFGFLWMSCSRPFWPWYCPFFPSECALNSWSVFYIPVLAGSRASLSGTWVTGFRRAKASARIYSNLICHIHGTICSEKLLNRTIPETGHQWERHACSQVCLRMRM